MSTGRVLAIVLLLLAASEPAAAGQADQLRPAEAVRTAQQGNERVIPPSMALSIALGYSPGSQGLDVTLVERGRPMYAVKLKTGNRVHRVLVDALTGQILGQ